MIHIPVKKLKKESNKNQIAIYDGGQRVAHLGEMADFLEEFIANNY